MKRNRISKKPTAAIRPDVGDKDNFISVSRTYQTMTNLRIQPACSTQPTNKGSKSEASKVAVMLKFLRAMKGSNTEN
jgi:hypothetical protein